MQQLQLIACSRGLSGFPHCAVVVRSCGRLLVRPLKRSKKGNQVGHLIPYKDRLEHLHLVTSKQRRLRGDMTEVYKIVTNQYETAISPVLEYHTNTITRGNKYNLHNQNFHYDVCKYSFTPRIVNTWNSLPDYVANFDSVEVFKKRFDKFWSNQPVKFDWKGSPTGIGDRTEYSVE